MSARTEELSHWMLKSVDISKLAGKWVVSISAWMRLAENDCGSVV